MENYYNRVFISYAKEDNVHAHKIFTFLKGQGFEPWLDIHNILPGEDWDKKIQDALRGSDFVILLLSHTSVKKRGYVQREFNKVLEYLEEKLDSDIYIIPVKLDDCEVPHRLQRLQWIGYENEGVANEGILESLKKQQTVLTQSGNHSHSPTSLPHQDSHILFRHLALKNHRIAKQIFNNDLSELPIENVLLHHNNISGFGKHLLCGKIKQYASIIFYRTFQDKQEVLDTYPDIQMIDRSMSDFPYYRFERIPTKEEILPHLDKLDGVTRYLLAADISVDLFAKSLIYEASGCGDGTYGSYEETIVFRDIWFTFLAIENRSDKPLTLSQLTSTGLDSGISYRLFEDITDEVTTAINFPKTPIKPGTTVLVPTGLLARPFGGDYGFHEHYEEISRKQTGEDFLPYTMLTHLVLDNQKFSDFMLFGSYLRPKTLSYSIAGREFNGKIHDLNPNNLYTIDEYWDCGSCPHLFVQLQDGNWHHSKELLTKETRTDQHEFLTIEKGIKRIRIAELENETTFIRFLKKNGITIFKNIEMINGDTIELNVSEGDRIHIYGHYEKEFENIPKYEQTVFRNRLIASHLKSIQIAK